MSSQIDDMAAHPDPLEPPMNIARRHLVTCSLAIVSTLSCLDASATYMEFIDCPSWVAPGAGGNFSSPQGAVAKSLQNDNSLPAACKPFFIGGCSVAPGGPIHYNCPATGADNPTCPTPYSTSQQATGSGHPVPGNIITYGADPNGQTSCGFWADDAHDPKNSGPPNCPQCGNPQANPINIATGNNIQRE